MQVRKAYDQRAGPGGIPEMLGFEGLAQWPFGDMPALPVMAFKTHNFLDTNTNFKLSDLATLKKLK